MKRKITCLIMCAVSCAMVAQTTGEEAGHTWIDMGLPSGIKWASVNIGGLPTLMAQVINRSRSIQMLMA